MSSTPATGLATTEESAQAQPRYALSFTFDDGPDETWTPRVLEQLARCEVTATFFMVGERVRAHPYLARTVLAAGHEIQLHCDRHIRHTELTEAELQLDTEMALDALATVDVSPQLWRAPWGICTDASVRVAAQVGLQLVRWSIDTHDWRGDQPRHMLADAHGQLADGGAVLMHDAIGPGARRAGCQNTIALLPALAAAARADGIALAPMQHQAIGPPAIEVPGVSVQQLPTRASTARLEDALARIAQRAAELDRQPRFPTENFADLLAAGALRPSPDGLAGEARLVRAVAAADASTARILDGHLNGIERLTLAAPEPLRSTELTQIQEGELLLGVWGADPAAGEGPPARLEHTDGQPVLRGAKTFCSGAGGVQRALILAADHDGSRRLVYLDTTSSQISIDRGWYQASGLRASESHRVEFHDTPILAILGGPGELSREPYFSRDAIRTSATWAGLADSIMRETLSALDPEHTDTVQAHMLGRMRVAQSTIDRWLAHTTHSLNQPDDPRPELDPAVLALECRVALTAAARLISTEAAQVCGSRALIGASTLDRARRDLDLFLMQHRLDPKIAKLGMHTLTTEGA